MELTQALLTVGALVGIAVVGLLAIIPTLLELPSRHSDTGPPERTHPSDPGHDHDDRGTGAHLDQHDKDQHDKGSMDLAA